MNKKDFELFEALLNKATRKELEKMKELLEREIRLSETAIKEGFEKRR